jgi:hypothetical protein
VRVILVRRRALGTSPEETDISWPPYWRLPSAGDMIHLSTTEGGYIEAVDFDLGRNAVRLLLR